MEAFLSNPWGPWIVVALVALPVSLVLAKRADKRRQAAVIQQARLRRLAQRAAEIKADHEQDTQQAFRDALAGRSMQTLCRQS